jgi:hypothetical protein
MVASSYLNPLLRVEIRTGVFNQGIKASSMNFYKMTAGQ